MKWKDIIVYISEFPNKIHVKNQLFGGWLRKEFSR